MAVELNRTIPAKNPHVVALRDAPHRRSMCETKMRYDVLLNDKVVGELYFNTRGYVGNLPLPNGSSLWMPEGPLSSFRKEVKAINSGARQAHAAPLDDTPETMVTERERG